MKSCARTAPPRTTRATGRGLRPGRRPASRIGALESRVGADSVVDYSAVDTRYVAMNRFRVQEKNFSKPEGADAKFEKRWAERPSRLATMDGFRWFALFRRVTLSGEPLDQEAHDDFNYTSMTLWEDKDTFQVWREGDAFKEAHGGGNIGGILEMLISSAQTLKGKPKLLLASAQRTTSNPVAPADLPKMTGGWRSIEADGVNILAPECFLSMDDYVVAPGQEGAFLQAAGAKIEGAKGAEGFMFGTVLNAENEKDEEKKRVFSLATVWADQSAYEAAPPAREEAGGLPGTSAAPLARHFEGKLVLTTEKGA